MVGGDRDARTPCRTLARVTTPADQPDPHDPDRIRAADADRERVAGLLYRAMGEGRLTLTEVDDRLKDVYAAVTLGELRPIVDDLPGHEVVLAPRRDPAAAAYPAAAAPDVVDGPESGNLAAVFGGVERKGRWVVPRFLRLTTVFGGADLDMTQAAFASRHSTMKVSIVFGGAQLTVPPGVVVHSNVTAIFGGTDNRVTEPAPPGAPVLEITGFAIFGGLGIIHPKRRALPGD